MTRTFSYALPGSMYEVSPDYGMMTQAWNIYSFAVPIVQQHFGIQPQTQKKKIIIKPLMPSEWNDAALENVTILDNSISVFYKKENGTIDLKIDQTKDWDIEVVFSSDLKDSGSSVEGKIENDKIVFTSKDASIKIQLSE